MTANIQISKKAPDGTILVLGGETWNEFATLVDDACNTESSEHIFELFADFAETGDVQARTVTEPRRIGECGPRGLPAPARISTLNTY